MARPLQRLKFFRACSVEARLQPGTIYLTVRNTQGFAIQLNHQRIAIHGHNGRRHFALAAYRFAAAIVVIGPPLVAVGIMASPIVEVISGVALSLGMLTLAFVLVLIALFSGPGLLPKVLLCAAALSLTATMALSTTYAMGEYMYPGADKLIPNHLMAATHGVVNVLGFTLCGGLGLFLLRRKGQ